MGTLTRSARGAGAPSVGARSGSAIGTRCATARTSAGWESRPA